MWPFDHGGRPGFESLGRRTSSSTRKGVWQNSHIAISKESVVKERSPPLRLRCGQEEARTLVSQQSSSEGPGFTSLRSTTRISRERSAESVAGETTAFESLFAIPV